MPVTVGKILAELEQLAPAALAESWDHVGLLIGDAAQRVSSVAVALDATPEVLDQAGDAELIVVHHPLIFSGIKRLVEDGATTGMIRRLVRENRSLIALHTNLDAAPEGLNQYVAHALGLRDIAPLVPSDARPLLKLVVYVPESHIDAVREAICDAGAGHIGHYSSCTFSAPGTGTYRPEAGADPYIGSQGELERVAELRLETVVPKRALGSVIAAMLAAHPYEEVAYDLFSLENAWPGAGLGRVGTLETPSTVGQFTTCIGQVLQTDRLSVFGEADRPVSRVALCTGAGGDFLAQAVRSRADLYLTGELKHHQTLQARQLNLPVVEAGHFATERPAVPLLTEFLRAHFPDMRVHQAAETDPLRRG